MLPNRPDMWYLSSLLTDCKKVCKNTLEKKSSLGPYFFPKCQNVLFIPPIFIYPCNGNYNCLKKSNYKLPDIKTVFYGLESDN